jgi:protein-tyrosine phosphatase
VVLDAHQVAPRLWQGSNPPEGGSLLRAGVDLLVLCAIEHQGGDYPGVDVYRAPMDDSRQGPARAADRAAAEVARYLREGRTVLVACHEGRNRSGLVCALALRKMGRGSGRRCADQVRWHRPGALTNRAFYDWLSSL